MATNVINPNAVHMVAGSSKIKATHCGHIYSVEAAQDTDNGCIVGKSQYFSRPEVYDEVEATGFMGIITGKAANGNWYVEVLNADNSLLVLSDPMTYWENPSYLADEKYFYNAKGEIMRCYELVPGDVFEISYIESPSQSTLAPGLGVIVVDRKVSVETH